MKFTMIPMPFKRHFAIEGESRTDSDPSQSCPPTQKIEKSINLNNQASTVLGYMVMSLRVAV